jgi:2-methylfumaryl-CoA isomerase
MYDLLKGVRLVEGAAFIAAPSCALLFAQMGAEVIRFEQIGGGPDSARWPLSPGGQSYYWEGLNKGKKSVGLNLASPEGRELAARLATSGDGLFVTNYPVDSFLSYERLSQRRADLIALRVMGWGDGKQGVDYTINAAAGYPIVTGHEDDARPVNHVLQAWDLMTGGYAAFTLLAALRSREATGEGRDIRLALSDMAGAVLGNLGLVAEVLVQGTERPRVGNDLYGSFGRDFVTRDGVRLMIVAITVKQWTGLIALLGIGEGVAAIEAQHGVSFTADEGARFAHRDQLVDLFARAIAGRESSELTAALDAAGQCWSVYRSLGDAIRGGDGMVTGNPLFSPVTHASGTYPTPGFPAQIKGVERGEPAPAGRIGQHTDEVLSSMLGMGDGEIAALHDRGVIG